MALLLMYNISPEKEIKIKINALKYGITCREVTPAEYSASIASLTGAEPTEGENSRDGITCSPDEAPFTDEMLVLCNFTQMQFRSFTDGIRASGAPVALKAMLTETNASWSSNLLHKEISAEHAAMKASAKKPLHKKK